MVESLVRLYEDVLFQRNYHRQFKEAWRAAELALESVPKEFRDFNPWLLKALEVPAVTIDDLVRQTNFHPITLAMVMVDVTKTKLKGGTAEAVARFRSEFPQWLEKFPWISDRIGMLSSENWIDVTGEIETACLRDLFPPLERPGDHE